MSGPTLDEKLVYMANQIARNLASQSEAKAVDATADHLRKFWDPRMRARIRVLLEAGGEGLDDGAKKAIAKLT